MAILQSVNYGAADDDGTGEFLRQGVVKMVANTVAINDELVVLKDKTLVKEDIATKVNVDAAVAGKVVDAKVLAENFMQSTADASAIGSTRLLANTSAIDHAQGQIIAGSVLATVSTWVVKASNSLGGGASSEVVPGSWRCLSSNVASNTQSSIGIGIYRRVA